MHEHLSQASARKVGGCEHPCPSLFHPTQSREQQQVNEGGKERAENPAGKTEKRYDTQEGIEEEEKLLCVMWSGVKGENA